MNYARKVAITLAALRLAQDDLGTLNVMPQLDDFEYVTADDINELCEEANVEAPKVVTVLHTHRHGIDVHHAMMAVGEEVPDNVDVVDFLGIEFDPEERRSGIEFNPEERRFVESEHIEIRTYEVSDIPRMPPTYKRGTTARDFDIIDLPEVDKTATLSTGHITKSDNSILTQGITCVGNPVMRDNYDGGMWIIIGEETTAREITDYGYSAAFAGIYVKLRELGFRYLRFDAAADFCEKLPTFEWESE